MFVKVGSELIDKPLSSTKVLFLAERLVSETAAKTILDQFKDRIVLKS
jgi:hypothetical protein